MLWNRIRTDVGAQPLTTCPSKMPKKTKHGDHLFVAFNRHVCALDKERGELVWKWKAPHAGYITLLCEAGKLFVAVHGYMYALDPATGDLLWDNEMKGFGIGVTSLATLGHASPTHPVHAAASEASKQRAMT